MADMIPLTEAGLRATFARHTAIANNLANIHTPDYRRKDVSFQDALADALTDGDPAKLEELDFELTEPRDTPVDGKGNDVDLDGEIANLLKNGGRYKLCMRLLTKTYRQMALAVDQR